jgi:DNA-binding beta-propeller fold protein YncE
MKKLIVIFLGSLLMFTLFTGCEDDPKKEKAPVTAAALYVLNSGGQSISVVDILENLVYNNVATVGTWPNQLVYRDGKLYCVNTGSNNIMIFDVNDFSATPEIIDLGNGNNPQNMIFYDDDIAYVSCSLSESVLKVNVNSKTVLKVIAAGSGCTGIAMANDKIYASNTAYDAATFGYNQGTVTVIDTDANNTILKTINVDKNPFSIGTAPDGKIHVVCTGNYWSEFGKVKIIDPATDTVVSTVDIGGSPGNISFSEADDMAFLTVWGGGCLTYDTNTLAPINDSDNAFLGKGGSGAAADKDGNVFVSIWDDDQVIQLDKGGMVLNTFDVGDSPSALAMKLE